MLKHKPSYRQVTKLDMYIRTQAYIASESSYRAREPDEKFIRKENLVINSKASKKTAILMVIIMINQT